MIPSSWTSYTRSDVSTSDISTGVRNGLEAWVKWERETKQLYESSFKDLMDLNEVAAACFVKDMVLDVTKELESAEHYLLNKKAADYNIGVILSEQDGERHKYQTKMIGI